MTSRRRAVRFALALLAVAAAAVTASAQTATLPPPVGETASADRPLAPAPSRLAVFGGAFYGFLRGSEIEKVDPGVGVDVGGSYRVLSDLSLWGSVATSSFDVSGQVTQLLDENIRDDGRSATVDGSLRFTRVRAGVRVDGLRQAGFRFQPYFVAAGIYTRNSWKLTTVDHVTPLRPQFVDKKLGGYGRFGMEFRVAPKVDVDGFACYEIFEFPAATNASLGVGAGVHVRL